MKGLIFGVLTIVCAIGLMANTASAICIGQATEFTVQISNTGSVDDRFDITPSDEVLIDIQDSVFIKAGETEVISFTATPYQVGTHPFTLTITSTKETKILKGSVTGQSCMDVNIIAFPT